VRVPAVSREKQTKCRLQAAEAIRFPGMALRLFRAPEFGFLPVPTELALAGWAFESVET